MARTVFTGGQVFDGTGSATFPVVLDDRVVEVREGYPDLHGTDTVVDVAGHTVMPGLVESHAHLTFPSAVGHIDPSFNPPVDVSFFHHIEGFPSELARAERNATILLDAGFTSAYSAGSLLDMPVEVALRDKIRGGGRRRSALPRGRRRARQPARRPAGPAALELARAGGHARLGGQATRSRATTASSCS